jgi:hypothetical protein
MVGRGLNGTGVGPTGDFGFGDTRSSLGFTHIHTLTLQLLRPLSLLLPAPMAALDPLPLPAPMAALDPLPTHHSPPLLTPLSLSRYPLLQLSLPLPKDYQLDWDALLTTSPAEFIAAAQVCANLLDPTLSNGDDWGLWLIGLFLYFRLHVHLYVFSSLPFIGTPPPTTTTTTTTTTHTQPCAINRLSLHRTTPSPCTLAP